MLDEPLAGLDPMAREMFLEFLEGLTGQGVSVVMVSHTESTGTACCTDHWNEAGAKLVMDGSCQEVLGRQQGRFRTIRTARQRSSADRGAFAGKRCAVGQRASRYL